MTSPHNNSQGTAGSEQGQRVRVNTFEGGILTIGTEEYMGILTIREKDIPELIERLQAVTHTNAPALDAEEQWRIEKYHDSMDLYLNGVFISKCKDMVSVQCVQDAVKRAQNNAAKAAREQVLDELTQMIKDNDMDKSDTPYFIHTSTIEGFIKSLRAQPEPQQEGRPIGTCPDGEPYYGQTILCNLKGDCKFKKEQRQFTPDGAPWYLCGREDAALALAEQAEIDLTPTHRCMVCGSLWQLCNSSECGGPDSHFHQRSPHDIQKQKYCCESRGPKNWTEYLKPLVPEQQNTTSREG